MLPLQPLQHTPDLSPLFPANRARVALLGLGCLQLLGEASALTISIELWLFQAGQLQAAPARHSQLPALRAAPESLCELITAQRSEPLSLP